MNQLNKLIEQSKLSPPFTKDDVGYIYDSNMVVVAQIRGWGHFQYLPNAEKLQDEFAQFIVDAMNEKLASRPTCGKEQRLFLDEVEKLEFIPRKDYNHGEVYGDGGYITKDSTNIDQDDFESDIEKVSKGG